MYHGIVLFDSQRRIVATSRPDYDEMLGTVLDETWAADALVLSGSQAYSVSQFQAQPALRRAAHIHFRGRGAIG